MNGIINILKPPGMTSQNVVSYVKRVLKIKKAGHTGTLDPGAAGVLPVCIGKATRVAEYLLNDKKAYRGELEIGLRSDTLDKYGIVEKVGIPDIDDDDIYRAFSRFRGRIEQLPPMFSAVKQNGKKLYELARQGIEVERKTREVFIHDLSIISIEKNKVMFDVKCSKGTYIRTLCSDIGKHLGSDAIMTFLLRTKTGPYGIEDAVNLYDLDYANRNGELKNVICSTDSALIEYSRVYVDETLSKRVLNGMGFYYDNKVKYEQRSYDDLLLIFDNHNNFIAIGKKAGEGKFIKIDKVFV